MDICKCGSAALNDHPESGLCDKCYWREQAKKLRARVEELEGKSGHWTKEPPTTPGWYKLQSRSCLTGAIEFSFGIAGPDCEWWNSPNEVLWRWSEPEQLPEPPKE